MEPISQRTAASLLFLATMAISGTKIYSDANAHPIQFKVAIDAWSALEGRSGFTGKDAAAPRALLMLETNARM